MPRTTEQRAAAAAAARKRYAADKDGESMRKLLARIKRPDFKPQLRTLERLSITLNEINRIRESHGLDPIAATTVRGRGTGQVKALREALAKERVDVDRVRASVIPTVTVVRQSSSPPAPARTAVRVETDADLRKTVVDLDYMAAAWAKTNTNPKKLADIRKNATQVLTALGYKGNGSIVAFLKTFDRFKVAVESLRKQDGQPYALATKLTKVHPFSSVLSNNTAPALAAQLPQQTAKRIITYYEDLNGNVQDESADRLANAQVPDWNRDVRPALARFLADTTEPLELRALVGLWTQMGGVFRTGAILNLHVTKSLSDATAGVEKNWLVLSGRADVTVVINNHKTGVSRGRTRGKSIIVQVDTRSRKWADVEPAVIGRWLRELAKGGGVLFPYEKSRRAFFKVVEAVLPSVRSTHVNVLRKSFETWAQANGDIDVLTRAKEILAHSIKTARAKYAQRRA